MAQLIEGKKVAESIYGKLTQEISALSFQPKIVFIRVGEDPASVTYVNSKAKRSEKLGALSETVLFPDNVSQAVLLEKIESLNNDPKVHGILVQLPLPKHLDKALVLETIDPMKDVDGLHRDNLGRLFQGQPRFIPCTPAGMMEMLKFYDIDVAGKLAVVVGRSEIVGKPAAQLLLMHDATVTIAHSRTRDLRSVTRQADILVAAAGKPHLIGAEHVKQGAVVLDVGIHRLNGKLTGDVDRQAVEPLVSAISPVPGGVGPMTICMLMKNLVHAAKLQAGL